MGSTVVLPTMKSSRPFKHLWVCCMLISAYIYIHDSYTMLRNKRYESADVDNDGGHDHEFETRSKENDSLENVINRIAPLPFSNNTSKCRTANERVSSFELFLSTMHRLTPMKLESNALILLSIEYC